MEAAIAMKTRKSRRLHHSRAAVTAFRRAQLVTVNNTIGSTVPLSKKGNRRFCQNYRTISLISIQSKVTV